MLRIYAQVRLRDASELLRAPLKSLQCGYFSTSTTSTAIRAKTKISSMQSTIDMFHVGENNFVGRAFRRDEHFRSQAAGHAKAIPDACPAKHGGGRVTLRAGGSRLMLSKLDAA